MLAALLFLVAWSSSTAALAQTSKPTIVAEAPLPMQPPSDFKVPLLDQPLHLSDFAGMQPRTGLRDHLTQIDTFIQQSPSDGKPATEKTEVFLGHTRSALYVVFICHDRHPEAVRSHLARRENVGKDDHVSILLDPFQDRRRGVLFTVNPVGVQADAAWTENNGPDYSYDQVWDSDGRITSDGWMAMIAIPFRSMRFRPGAQGWGVVLMRNLPRNSETDFWPRVSANVSGVLSQEGTLRGIEGVTGSHNLQLNPYALAQNQHTLDTRDPLNPFFSRRSLEGTAGGEAKAIIKDSIVLDATINPDFSDVESDQPQFTVNQRYPVFFPELRPFFLENANYFSTPISLVNTRNIVRPEFGARATGKIGGTNLGLLAIDDRAPGESGGPANPLFRKRALFAVGRVSQDLGKGSSIGAIYTDEEFAGSWNRIGGIDFTARINDKWTAQGQAVESSTGGTDRSYAAGPATYAEITRNGHAFNFDNTFRDFSTGFQSQVGFIQSSNFRTNQTHATYLYFPNHSIFQSYGIEYNSSFSFDHQGNRVQRTTQLDIPLLLARSTVLAPIAGSNSDTLTPAQFPLLPHNRNFSQNFYGLIFRSAPLPQISFNIVALRSGNVNFNPVANAQPVVINQSFVQAYVTVQPFRSLTIDNTYLLDRNRSVAQDVPVFENQTLRTKLNYQFTRAFSARVIAEYDSLLVNPAQTSLVRTKQVSTQALLTWLPHPGTAIYVGYNNDLQNLDRILCNRGPNGACNPNNTIVPRSSQYLNDGRQFFIKASYLLRF